MQQDDVLGEAERLMNLCNSCRYCEGLCAVFPAMELRREFASGDLHYLANLCHGCGACYYDCQFAPPHEFDVNVPTTLATLRAKTYQDYAWPGFLRGLYRRNGLVVTLVLALSVAAFILGFVALHDPSIVFSAHTGPGAFYRVMPHNAMVVIFGGAFAYAVIAIAMGVGHFWRDTRGPGAPPFRVISLWHAMRDAATLRYLDGGGPGCMNEDERPRDRRRLFHHFTFYGFLLCFASTTTATLYHYLLGMEAPYPWYDLPVLLGILGGIGLIVGPIGLLRAKWRRDPEIQVDERRGMDTAFVLMLLLVSVTGMLLLVLRATPAMTSLLALHLGVVFGFFISAPYSSFVHGAYRVAALIRYADERHRR